MKNDNDLSLNMWFKTNTFNFKNIAFWNAGKTGYQYTFACKQMNMFIGWMSQDSKFMVNVEQNLFSDEKDSPKIYIV